MFPLKSDLTGCQRQVRNHSDTGFLTQRNTLSSPKLTANPSKGRAGGASFGVLVRQGTADY